MPFKKIWKNICQILEGVSNTISKKEHIEKIAESRMYSCRTCQHFDIEGTNCMVPGTQPCCSICGCNLKFKTRSLSSECPHPVKRWGAVLTQEEEDKLYNDIDYDPNQS